MCRRISASLVEPRPSRFIAVLTFSLLLIFSGTGRAQVSTASLNGSVLDSSGARVPGAKIVVTQTETNFTTETESGTDGSFKFPTIPVGPYVVRVTKDHFSKYEQSGIVLEVGQAATLQITLTVGSQAQEVVVTADAPQVDSANSTIQHIVSQQAIVDIP